MSACIAVWCSMTALCGLVTNFWQLLLARIGVASVNRPATAALTMLADTNDAKVWPRQFIAVPAPILAVDWH